ncbi:MAG: methylenetetrahydrofolate reductase [NAD(P)H] [Kiritimatiellae bacterium]|nr:methylenetetrahydrofolate reductase [NAD(P)H] [Kiritimatiellia bacterium]
MKIADVLKRGISVSFEVFPPKKDAPFEPVKEAVARLASERPSFISVTYGAGGGASANTANIASFIQNDCATTALAHLTCVTATREEVQAQTAKLKAAGIENILALRGDIPQGLPFPPPGHYHHAVELVRTLAATGDFCLGGACYPECHPECTHIEQDIAFLKEKVDAGLSFLTTQMFFDNNIYYRYVYKLREAGITVPVLAGIMPVTNGKQIARICALSGTRLPERFRAIADHFGDTPAKMREAGVAYATEQIIDLLSNGVRAVHIYTMNQPDVAGRIMANLSSILER